MKATRRESKLNQCDVNLVFKSYSFVINLNQRIMLEARLRLKQAIDQDDAQETSTLLNQDSNDLLNVFCVCPFRNNL